MSQAYEVASGPSNGRGTLLSRKCFATSNWLRGLLVSLSGIAILRPPQPLVGGLRGACCFAGPHQLSTDTLTAMASWRHHENVVPSRRELQGALDVLLPLNLGEVGGLRRRRPRRDEDRNSPSSRAIAATGKTPSMWRTEPSRRSLPLIRTSSRPRDALAQARRGHV